MKPLTKSQIDYIYNWFISIDYISGMGLKDKFKEHFTALIPKKRTIKANRLYWLWMKCLEDEHGQPGNDFHELFKSQFIGVKTKQIFDKVILIAPSTKDLDTKKFNQYMLKVQAEAATEWNVTVPLPEDLGFDEFIGKYY